MIRTLASLILLNSAICIAGTSHVYIYGAGGSDMRGDWSLKYGGQYWTTLFGGTISEHSARIDNIFDAYGETYANWGAYVWNTRYYNEVVKRVKFHYKRDGYLGTFHPAFFADKNAIVNTGNVGTVSNVRWELPGENYIQGDYEATFDVSEGITSVGLGFVDTISDTQNYVVFESVEIETQSEENVSPAPLVDGQYLHVEDGHFYYNGARKRLWGVNFVCNVKQTLQNLPLSFDRIQDAGFNAIRLNLFDATFLDGLTADTRHVPATVVGSDSSMDRLDYSISLAKQRGMFFWLTFDRGLRKLVPGDYHVLPDDGHFTEWMTMVMHNEVKYLAYVDDRSGAAHIAYAKAILNHVNPYTGKRYADEETIGLAEIFNENTFVGDFTPANIYPTLPEYIKTAITAKLNTWLATRYSSHSALNTAWKVSGVSNLYSGESLTSGTIRFDYGPLNAGTRQMDMTRFAAWLYNDYNERFINEIRTTGFNAPITPTGQFDYRILRYYGAQMSGDFVSNGEYGFACRPSEVSTSDPNYPFRSRLSSHPYFEQPIDLMRVKGKPYAYYEVNDYRPNPYGVEFPIRIATLMAWQDGDAVFWFNWDDSGYLPALSSDNVYAQSWLPMPDANYPNAGLILASDEVQLAAIKSAGTIFLRGLLPCATSPLEWTIGKDLLFPANPASWNEREWWVRYHAWREGVRVIFNPEVNTSYVQGYSLGTSLNQGEYVHYDWADASAGKLWIDAPSVRAIVGYTGVSAQLNDLSISEMTGEFSSIVVAAEDSLPLSESRSILVTLLRDSLNTGYSFNAGNLIGGFAEDLARALSTPGGSVGSSPVIVDRVSARLQASWLGGLKYKKYNFRRECYEWGWVSETTDAISISGTEPLFYLRLIAAEKIPGDANDDGAVDVGDLGILAANYGKSSGAKFMEGDFNEDNKVDVGDLGILAANYGTGTSGVDFNADYAKVFGESEEVDDETQGSLCSDLGLPLIAGLLLLCLIPCKVES
jgi:hypothetical protein